MFIQLSSIERFSDVCARVTYGDQTPTLTWGAKIKLHGQQASVSVAPDGQVTFQSRRKIIDSPDECGGFKEAVLSWKLPWNKAARAQTVTFFGEWAGPGIQKVDAITKTDTPRFHIFAVGLGHQPHPQNPDAVVPVLVITEPHDIATLLPFEHDRVRVLPWDHRAVVSFGNAEAFQAAVDDINARVNALDDVDPYVFATYGVRGPGEGFVYVPCTPSVPFETFRRLTFKAKTERHSVRKQHQPAAPHEETPASVLDFVATHVTAARIQQAVFETCGSRTPTRQDTGPVISWTLADVRKESTLDRQHLGVDDRTLDTEIKHAARKLFFDVLKDVV